LSDTSFAETETTQLDPAFQEMMEYEAEVEESTERVGREPLPRGDYHIGQLASAEFREVYEDKIPAVRIGLRVVEGIDKAVDRTYYDDLFLGWGEMTATKEKDPTTGKAVLRPATAEEIAARRTRVIATLKRFARVFGLSTFLPPTATEEGVQAWLQILLEMKENGPRAIFTGGSNKKGFTFVIFDSLRSPSDPGKDPRTKEVLVNKTALDVAREEIKKAGGTVGTEGTTESGF
jgi:hypothetical protein